jgi:hypothetical protein
MKRLINRVAIVAAMAGISLCQDSLIRRVGSQLPHIKRERQEHLSFISEELDYDINALLTDKIDYVTWDH